MLVRQQDQDGFQLTLERRVAILDSSGGVPRLDAAAAYLLVILANAGSVWPLLPWTREHIQRASERRGPGIPFVGQRSWQ
ncbi:MAG: hypothetical protein DI562_20105 [Stenotrophomonas acidaminiphila]|nr:MAG: hypothetical protein DI562_20105 [Stenotrophomonas acidaminiphila]